MLEIAAIVLVVWTVLVVRVCWALPWVGRGALGRAGAAGSAAEGFQGLTVMVFLGSGGHTGEMVRILAQLDGIGRAAELQCVVGGGDSTSVGQLAPFLAQHPSLATQFITLFRARQVGESKLSSAVSVARSVLDALRKVVLRPASCQPDLFVANGPGTCVVLVGLFFAARVLGLNTRTRLVYIESLARVRDLSLSGKCCYYLTDAFVVQWRSLQLKYPRSECYGILV